MLMRVSITNALILLLLPAITQSANAVEYYVSPTGNDRWSGTLPAPNKKMTDGPFATLERAREAVRQLKKKTGGLKSPVNVYLREGTYPLLETFYLGPEDSGAKGCPITYASYPGEKAVLSVGTQIKGFSEEKIGGKTVWTVEIPEVRDGKWYFKQLWVNGERRFRPRLPEEGLYRFAEVLDMKPEDTFWVSQNRMRYEEGQINKDWENITDVEVVSMHLWTESRLPIASVDSKERIVNFKMNSVFQLTEDWTKRPAPYYLENVFEALDKPGEWYLDRQSGKLYYIPKRGEKLENVKVFAPRLAHVVIVQGDKEKNVFAEYIRFHRLGFSHTEWEYPDGKSGDHQAAVSVPGALLMIYARNCEVRNCEIANVGGYGIEIVGPSENNSVVRNKIYDLGAGGVKVGHNSQKTIVADNEIGSGGHIFHSAVGVWVGNSGRNKVLHNHIHHFYYTGVSVGWNWGYGHSLATANDIGWNYIHHIGQGLLSDMGGIYHLSVAPGTVIHHNFIHDVYSSTYGGWGIYLDEGSTNVKVFENIVYDTKTGSFHLHYGKNNVIRNNIFAFAREWQIQHTRIENHKQFTFERNIVIWQDGPVLHSQWRKENKGSLYFDRNIYFNTKGKPLVFGAYNFEEWQGIGQDVNSIIADPKIENAELRDFRLKKDSPALKMGFKLIDLSKAGPRYEIGIK